MNALTAAALLLAAMHAPAVDAAEQTAVRAAAYRGDISAENNRRFFATLPRHIPAQLVIDSPGGEVEAGIELGRWVHRNRLDILVEGRCLSSCANYVFTAGHHKIVRPGGIVAWHGNYHHLEATGGWRDDIPARMERTGEDRATAKRRVRAQMRRLVARERDFFRDIGVDQYLCWVGKQPPFSAPDYYTLGARDMARFGVRDVRTPSGYGVKGLATSDANIVFLTLGEAALAGVRSNVTGSTRETLPQPRPAAEHRQADQAHENELHESRHGRNARAQSER